jgi:2-hydroxychromene-2-carboxylate isomerase
MYSDYKTPFAWLAFDPAFELQNRYRIRVSWIPFNWASRVKASGAHTPSTRRDIRTSMRDAGRSRAVS